MLKIFHGTSVSLKILTAGHWVSLDRDEAVGYANAASVSARVGTPGAPIGDLWLLEMAVARDDVDWIDGQGDSDYDGKHGRLKVDAKVIVAVKTDPDGNKV